LVENGGRILSPFSFGFDREYMNDKAELRREAEQRRRKLACAGYSAAIAAYANELALPEGAVVSGYWAFHEEADPHDLMLALAAKDHSLALPCVVARHTPLRFHLWHERDAMRISSFGVTEPHVSAEVVTPSVLLVPLLAFDADGYRLGYGGGYYDRTLEVLRTRGPVRAIGIAYAGQEMPALPREAHDQRLDAVLTEQGLRRFA
jgi:5-formyltetrahydrofolate cyclo-ligase